MTAAVPEEGPAPPLPLNSITYWGQTTRIQMSSSPSAPTSMLDGVQGSGAVRLRKCTVAQEIVSLSYRQIQRSAGSCAPPQRPRLHLMQKRRDQRRHPRKAVNRPARVIHAGGSEPCRINDVSVDGAKLTTPSSSWLPKIFDLEDVFSGVSRAAARVWSKHHFIGVRFPNRRS